MAVYKKKVLFVDEEELFTEGLLTLFKFKTRFEVADIASDWVEMVSKTRDLLPDLVMMNGRIPHSDWFKAISSTKEEFPSVTFILLTMDKKYCKEALKAGVNAFI